MFETQVDREEKAVGTRGEGEAAWRCQRGCVPYNQLGEFTTPQSNMIQVLVQVVNMSLLQVLRLPQQY